MNRARYWVEKLKLQKHPEGGWFAETYRSEGCIPAQSLAQTHSGARSFSTAIYFLLESADFSAFHKIKSDEVWHFYTGSPIAVFSLNPKGELKKYLLGVEHGFQTVIKAGDWFAAKPLEEKSFSLVGCTVAPGFDFSDFELAKRRELCALFPQHKVLIEKFTRQ